MVLSEETDNIFGAELHFAIEPLGIVAVVDADIIAPGDQLKVDGDLLALTGKEPLLTDGSNAGTAQVFIAQNEVSERDGRLEGDFTFTLLGNALEPADPTFSTPPLTPDLDGRIYLARLEVEALAEGDATITFDNPDEGEDPVKLAMIVDDGIDPLPNIGPTAFMVPAANITVGGDTEVVKITLQGSGRLDPAGWEIPLQVMFFAPNSDVLTDTPVAVSYCGQLVREAPFGVCEVPTTLIGTFDIAVTSVRTLLHVARDVTVPGTIEFVGPADPADGLKGLHEGDMNEDGTINATDFSIWLGTWLETCPDTLSEMFLDFPAGDLDKNCSVGLSDFTLFLDNYRDESPQEE